MKRGNDAADEEEGETARIVGLMGSTARQGAEGRIKYRIAFSCLKFI